MKSPKNLALLVLLLGVLSVGSGALAQEKVRVSYSSRSYSSLPAYIAQASGFFRDESLDVELIQMRPATSSPALYNGDVQATNEITQESGAFSVAARRFVRPERSLGPGEGPCLLLEP